VVSAKASIEGSDNYKADEKLEGGEKEANTSLQRNPTEAEIRTTERRMSFSPILVMHN